MKIVGCDLHARQQTIAMVDTETGEFVERTLSHEGNAAARVLRGLGRSSGGGHRSHGSNAVVFGAARRVGNPMPVGHPAEIRAKETRKQKHDRRDARLILELLIEDRFPEIWMPTTEERDLRALLRDRHQWVKMRARLQHTLQAIALNHALRQGHALWSQAGQSALQALPLPPYTSQRRRELLILYLQLQRRIQELDKEVEAPSPTKATSAPVANASRGGCGDGFGDRCVSRGPESLRHRQPGG
jgi:transposase